MSTLYNRHPRPPLEIRQERRHAAKVLARTLRAVRPPSVSRNLGKLFTLRKIGAREVVRVPVREALRLLRTRAWLPTTRAAWKRRGKSEKTPSEQRGTLARFFGSTLYRRRAAA
jgi:hypothetical protein